MTLPKLLRSAATAVAFAMSLSLAAPARADDAKTLRVGTFTLFGVASTFEQAGHDKVGDIRVEIIPSRRASSPVAEINAASRRGRDGRGRPVVRSRRMSSADHRRHRTVALGER